MSWSLTGHDTWPYRHVMTRPRGEVAASSKARSRRTTQRSFRIPDPRYERAKQAAALNGESVAQVVNRKLEEYIVETFGRVIPP